MARIRSTSAAGGTRSSAVCTRVASRWPMRPTSSAGECMCAGACKGVVLALFYGASRDLQPRPSVRKHMNAEQAYETMIALSREETLLASCLDLLEWDEEVCMPRHAVEHRAEQRALLAGLVHDRETDPRYDDLLAAVEGSALVDDPASPVAVNVREIRRAFDKERLIPRRLAEEWPRVAALRGAPPVPRDVLTRDFPVDRQKMFVEAAAHALGFDLFGGRLDVAQHPFCTAIGPGDVRITLRYDEHDVSQGFFSLMHE